MTPEAQRIAIAEACGWTVSPNMGNMGGFIAREPNGHSCYYNIGHDRHDAITRNCPDYPADLNAMHEAEKVLTEAQQAQYAMTLHEMHGTPLATFWHRVICSTAAQRAEAFLRTIGKWENNK